MPTRTEYASSWIHPEHSVSDVDATHDPHTLQSPSPQPAPATPHPSSKRVSRYPQAYFVPSLQSSIEIPGPRLNSLVFAVTTTRPRERACPGEYQKVWGAELCGQVSQGDFLVREPVNPVPDRACHRHLTPHILVLPRDVRLAIRERVAAPSVTAARVSWDRRCRRTRAPCFGLRRAGFSAGIGACIVAFIRP